MYSIRGGKGGGEMSAIFDFRSVISFAVRKLGL